MLGDEWLLSLDDLVNAAVGVEYGLNVVEGDDGAVRTAAAKLTTGGERGREADGIVEGQTERLCNGGQRDEAVKESQVCAYLVSLFATLAAIETRDNQYSW